MELRVDSGTRPPRSRRPQAQPAVAPARAGEGRSAWSGIRPHPRRPGRRRLAASGRRPRARASRPAPLVRGVELASPPRCLRRPHRLCRPGSSGRGPASCSRPPWRGRRGRSALRAGDGTRTPGRPRTARSVGDPRPPGGRPAGILWCAPSAWRTACCGTRPPRMRYDEARSGRGARVAGRARARSARSPVRSRAGTRRPSGCRSPRRSATRRRGGSSSRLCSPTSPGGRARCSSTGTSRGSSARTGCRPVSARVVPERWAGWSTATRGAASSWSSSTVACSTTRPSSGTGTSSVTSTPRSAGAGTVRLTWGQVVDGRAPRRPSSRGCSSARLAGGRPCGPGCACEAAA